MSAVNAVTYMNKAHGVVFSRQQHLVQSR